MIWIGLFLGNTHKRFLIMSQRASITIYYLFVNRVEIAWQVKALSSMSRLNYILLIILEIRVTSGHSTWALYTVAQSLTATGIIFCTANVTSTSAYLSKTIVLMARQH